MATIPVVWCKDPNSSDPKLTAFALRGIQLQGDHITPQHMKALKELVNAASEGRFVLPANGSIMFLDCGLNINSEVQVAHGGTPQALLSPSAAVTLTDPRSGEEIAVKTVVELSDDVVKDDKATTATTDITEAVTCDSCVPYSEYELLYEFLCCAKCMNDRLAEKSSSAGHQQLLRRGGGDKGGRNVYASEKEPAPYIHFCDKAAREHHQNNNRSCGGDRVIRKYPVEHKEPCREGDTVNRQAASAQVMDNSNCNCSTAARARRIVEEQLPPVVPRHRKVNHHSRPVTCDDDGNDENKSTATDSRGVNARAQLHNARLGTIATATGGRRSSSSSAAASTSINNHHHHQLRNKRIDRNCGRISIRRSKRRVECPRGKKVLMTHHQHPQQQLQQPQQGEQNPQQQPRSSPLRPRQRCDVEDHKIVVASKEISKREIERLLYARVNKLMKKKHRKELRCSNSNKTTFGSTGESADDLSANEQGTVTASSSARREHITPVIVVDPPPKSNPSSRKTSFDSTCTVNSHDSGFIDILNRIDSSNNHGTTAATGVANGPPEHDTMNNEGQFSDKPVDSGEQLVPAIRKDSMPSDVGVVADNSNHMVLSINNNKIMENLFAVEKPESPRAALEYGKHTDHVPCLLGPIAGLTQSKNRRKSYEEFRSMFRDSDAQFESQGSANLAMKSNKLLSEEIEEHDELAEDLPVVSLPQPAQPLGDTVEGSGKQYLLNPDQIQQIKMRRKSYEEFKLMMRDPSTQKDGLAPTTEEPPLLRSGSMRFSRKNSNRRRKSSLFAKFASTKEESEHPLPATTKNTVIYDLLPKLEAAKGSESHEQPSSSIVKMGNFSAVDARKCSKNLDTSSLSRLKKKLRESNSDLYEKLITYGTIYDIIQKKNLSYRKYDKYMTYGTIYEILHRKSSITSNQNTYENFNYLQRKKSSTENVNEKSDAAANQNNNNTRKVRAGIKQQRKSLSDLVPYFATNFIAKDVTTTVVPGVVAHVLDRSTSASTNATDADYRMTSPSSCGTIYDMKRASEPERYDVQNTRFTVHRIEENELQKQVKDLAAADSAMGSMPKKKLPQSVAPMSISAEESPVKPVSRRRRFSNILKLEYRPQSSGGVQLPSEIPQIMETADSDLGGGEDFHDTASANLNCRHTKAAVGAADEGQHQQRMIIAKAYNDNYAKIKIKALFNEKSSIFKSNSLDMLSNVTAGSYPYTAEAALSSPPNFFGECPLRGSSHAGYAIKKNNSDSSLSTKYGVAPIKVSTLAGLSLLGPGRLNSVSVVAADSAKCVPKSDDLKTASGSSRAVSPPPPTPPTVPTTTSNSNLHLNIKKLFGRKNASRRLSEFTRGEFLNEKP